MPTPVLLNSSDAGRQRGFTFIELISVLVLIGILAAIIFPRFLNTQGFQQRIFTDQLANSLLEARLFSLSRSQQQIELSLTLDQDATLNIISHDQNSKAGPNKDPVTTNLVKEPLDANRIALHFQTGGQPPQAITQLQVVFDSLGNIIDINRQKITTNGLFIINDRLLCLSSSGLAWPVASTEECLNG